MTNKTKLTRIAAAVALTLGMSSAAVMAQETSSSIRGQIVDQQGCYRQCKNDPLTAIEN